MEAYTILFAVLLFLLCAALIIAEVFVPSGGVISVFAVICLLSGIFMFFKHSVTAGWIGIGTAMIMVPVVIVLGLKLFPHSPFGRAVILAPPERPRGDAIPDTPQISDLLGKTGTCLTDLRPVGTCEISGTRVECVAETGYIEKDSEIKIIRVEGTQLTARLVETS